MRSRKRAGIALFLLLILLIITAKVRAEVFLINNGETSPDPFVLLTGETGVINLGGKLLITRPIHLNGISSTETISAQIINFGTIEMNVGRAAPGRLPGRRPAIVYDKTTDSSILNSGIIKTAGYRDFAVYLTESMSAHVTNSEGITTEGKESYGIYSDQARGRTTITNSIGSWILTKGERAHGIYSRDSAGTNTITNSGTITASGHRSEGVYSFLGTGTTRITNSGTILTSGSGSYGIHLNRFLGISTIENSGFILTGAETSHGISISRSSGNTITNSGTITTEGLGSYGIHSFWSTGTNRITNSGTISTHGNDSHGISLLSNDGTNTIDNSSTITTSGDGSHGIYSYFNTGTNTILNSSNDTIRTTGVRSHGIFVNRNRGEEAINNSGTIQVNGAGSVGVGMIGGVTLTNSGTISATGKATRAIVSVGDYNDTLNLLPGSNIIGTIHLGDGADKVNISSTQIINRCATAACTSASLYIGGSNVDINVSDPTAIHVIGPNSVATVDPTGHSVLGVSLSEMTSALHDVVSQRMARTRAPASEGSQAWGEAFGAYRKRGAEGAAFAHNHRYMGYTGGIEKSFKRGSVGLMAGYANSRVATKQDSNSTNTNTFFAGLYSDVYLGRANLTTSLLGGYEFHDNTRLVQVHNLGKTEAAKADFSSVFFTPSVTLSTAQPLGSRFELRPSTSVIYTLSRYTNYQERGTTGANLFIDGRTVQVLKAKVQLALALKINKNSEFELRTGFTTRHTDHDDIKASMGKSTTRFAAAGKNTIQGGFIGGNLRLHITENFNAIADVKFRGAGGHESEIVARAGIGYRF